MKKIVLLLAFCCFVCVAKAQFTDNFSDSDFTNNPTWRGTDTAFVASTQQLRLQTEPISGSSYLSTASQAIQTASWQASLRLDFNGSSTNFAKIYLVSNKDTLTNALNGYFVKIGNTDDEVSLYKQTGSTETKIIDGTNGRVGATTVPQLKIKVTRDNVGNWQLFSDTSAAGASYVLEGSVLDATHTVSSFFGVVCVYTSTRSDKFYFDNFVVSGTPYIDAVKPTVLSANLIGNSRIGIRFSEALTIATAQNVANYTVNNGVGSPVAASLSLARDSVTLDFSNNFLPNTNHNLMVSGVQDVAGNAMLAYNYGFNIFGAAANDVVFNEIFADPTPQIGLPNAEFVEFYNRTNAIIELRNWVFSDATSSKVLPAYSLAPSEYVILCASSKIPEFNALGITKILGLSSFPSLNVTDETLTLKDNTGKLINSVRYYDSWYQDAIKKQGGYTLEKIDVNNLCGEGENWLASTNPSGGTAAAANSVAAPNPDTVAPELLSVFLVGTDTLILNFSRAMNLASLQNLSNYSLSNGAASPTAAIAQQPNYTSVKLAFFTAFLPNVSYQITANGVLSCALNPMAQAATLAFGIASAPDSNDLVINEILFDPQTGGKDFVELYNRSNKIINLKNLFIATINIDNGQISQTTPASTNDYLLMPQGYVVLTELPEDVKARYFCENALAFSGINLPTYSTPRGGILLTDASGKRIDAVFYDEKWHYTLLNSKKGVSLERINPDADSNDKNNWFSAASTSGFATPTYKNSQFYTSTNQTSQVILEPKAITPNADGYDDQLFINYNLDAPGYQAKIIVFDAEGRFVKTIANGETLSQNGNFTWNAIDEKQKLAQAGIYIIYFEAFNLQGKIIKFKDSFVVGKGY